MTNPVNYQPPPGSDGLSGTAQLGTALLTDHYELTMLQASLRSGAADRRAIFEVFARHLPHGRRYGVVAGTGRLLDAIERFRFGPADLEFLGGAGIVDEPTLAFLESYRFGGNIWGYSEGDCYFPGSPILVVEGTFAEAVLLETVTLSILNHDCAIASAASRMVTAAGDRPLIEMGSRRTHERAAVASARAAYIAGFASTSNLRARYEHGIPSAGTSAHAFTLVHDSERHAFETQLEALGKATTLLVDTYDVPRAVRTAVEVAGRDLGAVRIDSGDLPVLARQVRALLDELGATQHPDHPHRRPGRVLHRGARRGPGGRLRGGHVAGHRFGRADGGAGVQAGGPGLVRRRRRDGAGGQALGGQAGTGRAQVGGAAPRRARHRAERADQPDRRRKPGRWTGNCSCRWWPTARSSGVRGSGILGLLGPLGWRRPGRGTASRWPSCRRTRCSCPAATPPSPPSSTPDGAES